MLPVCVKYRPTNEADGRVWGAGEGKMLAAGFPGFFYWG